MTAEITGNKCVVCGVEAPGTAGGACSSCGAPLSVLHEGLIFCRGRFRVDGLYCADRFKTVWHARDLIEDGAPYLLAEYDLGQNGDLSRIKEFQCFHRLLVELAQVVRPPSARVPAPAVVMPIYPFTWRGHGFLAHPKADMTALRTLISGSASPREKEVLALLESLLAALDRIHNGSSPLFCGSLTLDQLFLRQDWRVEILGVAYPTRAAIASLKDFVRGDLRQAGIVAAQLLCGTTAGAPDAPPGWSEKAASLSDPVLSAVLEWLIQMPARAPGGASEVRAFIAKMREAAALRQERRIRDARGIYAQLYNCIPLRVLKSILDRLPGGETPLPPRSDEERPQVGEGTGKTSEQAKGPVGIGETPAWPQPTPEPGGGTPSGNGPQGPAEPGPDHTYVQILPKWIRKGRRRLYAAAGAAALILILAYAFGSGAQERKFEQAIRANKLVSEEPGSAYSIYEAVVREEGPNSSTVRRMNKRIKPLLDKVSDERFQKQYKQSDIRPYTWDDMVRLESWRSRIREDRETRARHLYAQGMAALIRRNRNGALQFFYEAVSVKPDWALALNGIGRCYFQLKDYRKAEKYYHLAKRADPSWPFPLINLANLYRDALRDPVEAERHYLAAISLDPSRASFHYGLATLYYSRGAAARSLACEEYRKALNETASETLLPSEIETARTRVAQLCQE